MNIMYEGKQREYDMDAYIAGHDHSIEHKQLLIDYEYMFIYLSIYINIDKYKYQYICMCKKVAFNFKSCFQFKKAQNLSKDWTITRVWPNI